MIFDLRIYTLHPHKAAEWLKVYEQYAYPIQVKHLGKPVLFSVTEVGPLNQAIHVWKYESQAEREAKRAAMAKDPDWQAYIKRSTELAAFISQENRLLKSTSFSPL